MLRCGAQHRQAAHGHHQRAANSLKNTHGDKHIDIGRQPAKHRGEGKNRQRQAKDFPRAEAIGDPAAGGYQHRKGNKVGANSNVEIHCRYAEVFRHVGQGGGDDCAVEELHKKRASHQQSRC